ncbi:MAG: arginine decarboxylase [Chloroflexaceae bacterium]|nr:arginine decarboxylase [Chloroflexaceae bacterium]
MCLLQNNKKEVTVPLKQQTYARYLWSEYQCSGEGAMTDFLSRHDGQLYFGDTVNLNELVERYGTPLEVVYCPQITTQIRRMQAWASQARQQTHYDGRFLYAYATKANFAAETVQTALAAGAHYETSAATDVEIAGHLWQRGTLPDDRLICCNGSKETAYLEAIQKIRLDGCTNIVPVVDDLHELQVLSACPAPLQMGVRERAAGNRDGRHPGNNRFGLTASEIDTMVEHLAETSHQLVLYHAMIGSQVEDQDHFLATLGDSIRAYCQLRQRVPSLRYFNFGGGMPTSGYRLDFQFDYAGFLTRLMTEIKRTCQQYNVPMPDLIGEFGRYTVATHRLYLLEVGSTKAGQQGEPDWYLVNGSLMVSMPDMLLVDDQEFVILPLDHWDQPVQPVRLAGRRTCDSDDVYPALNRPPLLLPAVGSGMVVAVCGIGAYQQMLSGRGGAHHCLTPEPRRLIIKEVAGRTILHTTPPQDQTTIMQLLGYQPQPTATPVRIRSLHRRRRKKAS